jgi:hypothetical protein
VQNLLPKLLYASLVEPFQVTSMGAKEWIISLALGFVALPLGALIRLVPNEHCERVFVKLRLLPKPEEEPTFPPDVEAGFAFALDACAVHPLFARVVRLHLILMDHILCKF